MRTKDIKSREAKEIRATFGDLEIKEAKADTYIFVSKNDIEEAVPGDPNNCMFSKACKRSFGSRAVLFYPSIAYVDMTDEKGGRVAMRFRLSKKVHDAILSFDADEEQREATFKLGAVSRTRTLEHARKVERKRMREIKAGRPKNEKAVAVALRGAHTRKVRKIMGLRDGRGKVVIS